MELVIDDIKKGIAESLMDPTPLRNCIHYMREGHEGIEMIVVVQEGYDMPEVVSPLMVRMEEKGEPELIDGMSHNGYMQKLMKEGVIRIIVPKETKEKINDDLQPFFDTPEDYEDDIACLVIILPPIYWVKSMGKKWD